MPSSCSVWFPGTSDLLSVWIWSMISRKMYRDERPLTPPPSNTNYQIRTIYLNVSYIPKESTMGSQEEAEGAWTAWEA